MWASDAMERTIAAARLGNKELAKRYCDEAVEHMRNQISAARQLLDQIKDPKLRKEMSDAIDRLERLIPEIQEAAAYAAAHPDDPAAQKRLRDLMEKARKEMNTIGNITKKHEEQRLREEAEKPKETFTINKAVPQDLSNAMKGVMSAGSGSIFPANSPQGKLVASSKLMVQLMERLAIAADQKDLKGVIAASKEIFAVILEIQKQAQIVHDECRDPKLKEQLANSMGVPKNFTMQLKIIATMKAAQGFETKDKEQIFGLSKKVCNSVEEVVRSSEIAALAKKK